MSPSNKITFGTYRIKTLDDIYNGLDIALSNGIRYFDTAELYKNHHLIGLVLNNLLDKYNITRKDIKITTKISFKTLTLSNEDIIKSIDKIFDDLQIDYLDTLLIHAPTNDDNNKRIWSILCNYTNKIIYNIGVSNFRYEHIKSLNEYININQLTKIYINQIELNPFVFSRQKQLIEYCKENDILISLYGLFYHLDKYIDILPNNISIKRNHLIKWSLFHNFIPNIKTLNKEILDEILCDSDNTYNDYLDNIEFNAITGFQYTKYNTN